MMDRSMYAVFLLLTLVTGVRADARHACTRVRRISQNHFQIRSPNYGPGKSYPPNTNCQWDIQIPRDQEAKLSFMIFDLEYLPGCKWDGVELYRGTCSNKGPLIIRHCGVIPPSPVIIGGAVCLTFWSDAVGHRKGFKLSVYLLKPKNKAPGLQKEYHQSRTKNTHGTPHYTTNDTTTPVLFPEIQKEHQNRKLQMIAVLVANASLTTEPIDTKLKQGQNVKIVVTSTNYNTYQRTTEPLIVNAATTKPVADEKEGTRPKEQLKDSQTTCSPDGVVLTEKEATIYSPNYGSGNYPTDITCKWIIKGGEGERIRITFDGFQLEWERNCGWDSLAVIAGNEETEYNLMGRFCGSQIPPNIISPGNTVVLNFRSDGIAPFPGFRLKYEMFRHVESESECGKGSQLPLVNYYIFGGTLADAGDVPWQASIRRDGEHLCGGAILNQEWVVTAAHCVDMIMLSPYRVTVLVGSLLISGGSKFTQTGQASEILIHPTYEYAKSGDLALIRLLKQLNYTDYTRPICLPAAGDMVPAQTCYIAGWGATELKDGQYKVPSAELHKGRVKIWSQKKCNSAYAGRISEHMFCAGDKSGQVDSCKGDSGGVLMCLGETGSWKAEGIISWGGQCGQPGQPGVYTKLGHYVTWIREVIAAPLQTITCTFDASMCGYRDSSRGLLSWRRRDAQFPAPGFSSIRASSGYYLHVDGPSSENGGSAELIFPDVSSSKPRCLSLTYAISQVLLSELSLVTWGSDGVRQSRKLWTLIGKYQHDWKQTSITIQSSVRKISLVFTTEKFARDLVAIDNVKIAEGKCPGSVIRCDFSGDNACGYSQLTESQFNWTVASNPLSANGETDFYLVADGHLAPAGSTAKLQSPLYVSNIPGCMTLRHKMKDEGGSLKITTTTQHGGRVYFGDTLTSLQFDNSSSSSEWLTSQFDLPSSAYERNFVLEYKKGNGEGVLTIDKFDSYEGNCIV